MRLHTHKQLQEFIHVYIHEPLPPELPEIILLNLEIIDLALTDNMIMLHALLMEVAINDSNITFYTSKLDDKEYN